LTRYRRLLQHSQVRAIVAPTSWLVLIIALATSGACDSATAEDPCQGVNVAGLTVVVLVERAETRICDADVKAQEGLYWEALVPSGDTASCAYQGAFQRPGTYRVEASREGYVTAVEQNITIGSNACGAVPRQLELPLTPQTP